MMFTQLFPLLVALPLSVAPAFFATAMSSTNYTVDTSVSDSFGGEMSSTNYHLVDAGGETAVGESTSTSYYVSAGYVSQLTKTISMTADESTITIPALTGTASQSADLHAHILTNGAGYTLSINQDHDLVHTDTTTTIPGISGGTYTAWNEGTTKGFGYTVLPGAHVPGAWGAINNLQYRALTNGSFGAVTSNSSPAASTDDFTFRFRLDTAGSQKIGSYTNTVTLTAVTLL